jgi:hypothetical protein
MMKITGLVLAPPNIKTSDGSSVLAYFDIQHAGIALMGCVLARRTSGNLFMVGPTVRKSHHRFGAQIVDPDLRNALVSAAVEIFRAMGGAADWEPKVIAGGGVSADEAAGLRRFVG